MTRQETTGRETIARTTPARAGSVAGALGGLLLLLAVHAWPGWQVVPFLTPETPAVLGAVDAMLAVGIAVNLVRLLPVPAWATPAGTVLTSVLGLVATLRVLQVFPFDFGPDSAWTPAVRVLLVVGVGGAAIGALVAVVQLVRLGQVTRGTVR